MIQTDTLSQFQKEKRSFEITFQTNKKFSLLLYDLLNNKFNKHHAADEAKNIPAISDSLQESVSSNLTLDSLDSSVSSTSASSIGISSFDSMSYQS